MKPLAVTRVGSYLTALALGGLTLALSAAHPSASAHTVPVPAYGGTLERVAAAPKAIMTGRLASPARGAAAPGREELFWAYDFAARAYYRIPATLRHTSDVSRIYVENGRSVPLAAVGQLAELFEDQVYPRLRNRFGHEPEPGIDGDRAVTLLLLDVRDPYWHGTAPFTYYAGYFDPTNQYRQADLDRSAPAAGLRSNEREMVYLDVAPTIAGSTAMRQTLAHEFAHLITWNYDGDEETWLSEGLSELAIHVAGLGHPDEHVAGFLAEPERRLTSWSGQAADYGRVYLFLLYLYEQAGRAAEAGQIAAAGWPRRLVEHPGQGLAGLADTLPLERPLAELFRDWAVALHLDEETLADGRYGIAGLDLGGAGLPFPASTHHGAFPVLDEHHVMDAWSLRADRFVGARGDVDIVLAPGGALCAAAVAAHTYARRLGASTVLPACTDGQRALGWTIPRLGPDGLTATITVVAANAADEPLAIDLSALPPLGGFGWSPTPLLLPFLRR
jgi:hypothetical protein